MSGIYVHIPFCHSKCYYCDFYSIPLGKLPDTFFTALENEIRHRLPEIEEPIRTIYIGGGTPSSWGCDSLLNILSLLPVSEAEEITIEVNPEDVTVELITSLKNAGVNRISMGLQSLQDSELKAVGRRHDAASAIKAVGTIRECGIDNLSLDLIYGMPGQTIESWNDTLARTLDLNPEHLSAYTLMYEPGTRLSAMAKAGKITPTPAETIEAMYQALIDETAARGYRHYEISNFALPGCESRHNSAYWDFTPYIGFGPGAHGFDGKVRTYNPSDLKEYVACNGLITKIEEENARELLNDYVMVALRTARGLNPDDCRRRFGDPLTDKLLRRCLHHLSVGNLITLPNGCLRIPQSRWILSDLILSDLMEV